MGRGVKALGKGVFIPWGGGRYTMGRGQNTMGRGVDIPLVGGSIFHG